MNRGFPGIKAVLFDLDGTLIDSAPDLGAAADQMRVARGLPSLPLAQYRPMAGAGARGMLGVAFGITPDTPDYDVLREEFFRNYELRMTQTTYAFDGIAQLLADIEARGLAWGIVTNKSARFTDPLTRAMPLLKSARAVVSGDTTPHSKPHPEPLFEAARRLALPPEACIYVGDDERDIVAGRAAGMKTVAALYGYLGAVDTTEHWGADAAIKYPHELLQWLDVA
ncbi:HAD family hydrolase [Comamonas antarctica]|uniref:HAD-IA family hydrolase n=1 Tax=Comamonas antarctica TaxID=2743470 RepID=A0A6N1X387_9BURK|nr:HAD-IA family hydrolase [Comamonas antarctica]QKV52783.1 HAD-IA family hydrolase [Comamonas antarctica]